VHTLPLPEMACDFSQTNRAPAFRHRFDGRFAAFSQYSNGADQGHSLTANATLRVVAAAAGAHAQKHEFDLNVSFSPNLNHNFIQFAERLGHGSPGFASGPCGNTTTPGSSAKFSRRPHVSQRRAADAT
jgi:hypothetical protein